MSIAELSEYEQSRVFLLTVGGLSVRYYSGTVAPSTTAVPGTGGALNYTDVNAIVGVGNQRLELDPAKGIASESGVTVVLASRGTFETANDPARQLLRVGWRGADRMCTLATTLDHTTGGGATVEVDRDVTGWTTPALIHVGAEAIWATGTAAGPNRFTGCTRAAANTRPQAHIVDSTSSRTPIITSHCVNWRTRWALLQVANRRLDGSISSWTDVVRGFIESSPVMEDDGLTISLTILPLSGLLSMPIGGQVAHAQRGETHLVQGFHAIDGQNGIAVQHAQIWDQGAAFLATPDNDVGGAGFIPMLGNWEEAWGNIFEDTGGVLTPPHPRNGRLIHRGEIYEANGIDAVAGRINLQDATAPNNATSVNETIQNAEVIEIVEHVVFTPGTEQIVTWPEDLLSALNDGTAAAGGTGWIPGTKDGADGQWADVRVEGNDHPEGAHLAVHLNTSRPFQPLKLRFQAIPEGEGSISVWRKLWYGLDFNRVNDDPGLEGRRYPESLPSWRWTQPVTRSNQYEDRDRILIRGFARGYYQTQERFLLLEDDILDLTAGNQHVRVTYPERGETKQAILEVEAKSTAVDPADGATVIGYRYTLTSASRQTAPSFGDWPGEERVKVEPVASFFESGPTDIMLRLLISGQGVGTNSATYDSLPFGYNLDQSEVDVNSFTRYPVPAELGKWSLTITEGDSGEDVLGPMARALGAAIVTRLDQSTGQRRIALVPATLERALDASVAVTNGDIIANRRPTSGTDDKLVNRLVVRLFDPVSGEPVKPDIIFNDRPSIDEAGGETQSLELELRGLRIESDSFVEMGRILSPIFQSLSEQFGQARRVYRFGLAMAKALLVGVGDTITLTADDARGVDGTRGISVLPVRVLEVEHGWWQEGSTVRAVTYGLRGTGWAPALQVAAVVSPTEVTVEANAFTATENPITGAAQTDVSFWAAGQPCECVPRGNFAGRTVDIFIGTIVGNNVTFVDNVGAAKNHGLSVGDTIRPPAYDSAATAHQVYAYLADTNETLGASAVDAFEIV